MKRRDRRKAERESEKSLELLNELLASFYTFLERQPKPTKDEVRSEFLSYNSKWERHVRKKKLGQKALTLFKKEVSTIWKSRYTTKNENVLQKSPQGEQNCTTSTFRSFIRKLGEYASRIPRILRT